MTFRPIYDIQMWVITSYNDRTRNARFQDNTKSFLKNKNHIVKDEIITLPKFLPYKKWKITQEEWISFSSRNS